MILVKNSSSEQLVEANLDSRLRMISLYFIARIHFLFMNALVSFPGVGVRKSIFERWRCVSFFASDSLPVNLSLGFVKEGNKIIKEPFTFTFQQSRAQWIFWERKIVQRDAIAKLWRKLYPLFTGVCSTFINLLNFRLFKYYWQQSFDWDYQWPNNSYEIVIFTITNQLITCDRRYIFYIKQRIFFSFVRYIYQHLW